MMTTQKKYPSVIIGLLIIALLVGFWLRIHSLDQYPPGISNDEAVNTIDAFHLVQTGNFPLYQDQGRPDPLFRLFQAAGAAGYGSSIWGFRLTSAFFGTLTIAAAYFAATQAFHDLPPTSRRTAALSAALVIAVAIGHVTVTRSTYRAVPQPLFMFLATGFLMRGLRRNQWHDFLLSGVWVAAGLYTYTAAFMVPLAFFPLGLHLFIQRWRTLRQWLPKFVSVGIITAILALPIAYLLLTTPEAVTGRAASVSESADEIPRQIRGIVEQLYSKGDENPQYNVAQAPLLPEFFAPLFTLGLIALLIRFRQPSSTFILALLIVTALPVVLADELSHGLRIVGEYAVFPLVIAAAVGLLLTIAHRFIQAQSITSAGIVILVGLFGWEAAQTFTTYSCYWQQPDEWQQWRIHDEVLDHNEWFFRTDRRDFAAWIAQQEQPLLISAEEFSRPTTRAWLFEAYPQVAAVDSDIELPPETLLVVPWSLEIGDIMRAAKQYALLHNGVITLLPPFSDETQQQFMRDIEQGTPITRQGNQFNFLGYAQPLPDDALLVFEDANYEGEALASFGDSAIDLINWRGADTINHGEFDETLTYTLTWRANRRIGFEYGAYLQLQTQDYQRIAGEDILIHRWLFPTSIWGTTDHVPVQYQLTIPEALNPGAYRLVTGLYPTNGDAVSVDTSIYGNLETAATVGWIKVPQPTIPSPDDSAIEINARLGDLFQLNAMEINPVDDRQLQIRLYWQSQVDRPAIDATVFVHGLNQQGIIITQSDVRPWNGEYPTFIWDENEVVMTEHLLSTAEDDLVLIAGMYTQPDFTRLDVFQDNALQEDQAVQLGEALDLLR